MSEPRLTVCVGGGGVGKTTTSAALALRLARGGARTLVITVDPARRLADALGVEVGQATSPAHLCPRAEGRLFAKMPDPRLSIDDFMAWLFVDPAQRERVIRNPAYRELSDSLAGVHELLTLGILQAEIDSGQFDEIVLDTAPSRNALAFLTYPSRLLELLEAKALTWLSALASSVTGQEEGPKSGFFAWGRARVEAIFSKIVGLSALRNLSSLFAELVSVRQRWAELVRKTDTLFRDKRTRYLVIGAPTGGAIADMTYLVNALDRRKLKPTALVLNRAETAASPCERGVLDLLNTHRGLVPTAEELALRSMLQQLEGEHRVRAVAAERAAHALASRAPKGTPIVRLPFVGPASPQQIVLALADAWEVFFRN